jgi:dynein light intermediate chain
MTNYVKPYLESPLLLLYQPKVEISDDRNENDSFLSVQKKKSLPPIESNPGDVETLNAMFLPREWEEQGKKFIQYVSPEKASRDQAKDLFKALDEKIKERQAREKGICPVREELYAQCFDEIIRQVTIECPERGLLLLRVRDEIRMTIASYQTLYESAILFGIRKQLQAESGKEDLKNRLEELEKKKIELTNRVSYRIEYINNI